MLTSRQNHRIGRAMHSYNMLADGDRILVAVSGGVDSLVLARVLDFWRHKAPIRYDLSLVHIDIAHNQGAPGDAARAVARQLAGVEMEVELVPAIWRPAVFAESDSESKPEEKDVCFLCARHRRNQLFELARERNCTKVALGHHRNDIIETFFLNLLYGGNISTMVPRQDLFAGRLAIIRPLAFLEKNEIIEIAAKCGLQPIKTPCPAAGRTKRQQVRELVLELQQKFPGCDAKIFAALGNIRTDYLLKADGGLGARRKRPGKTESEKGREQK